MKEHELIIVEKDTLVKEFKPKYSMIELCEETKSFDRTIGIMEYDKVLEKYGDYTLISGMDFNDTKTTSFIIKKEKRMIS